MGDVFMERMVKKKFESTDALVLLGIIVAMVVVVFIGFIVGFVLMPMPMITFLVVIGAGFGGYKLLTMRLLEYEYSLTNGYVAVDKIMNRASRKRMTAFECSSAEDIGEYQKNEGLTYELAHALIDAIYVHGQDSVEIVWKFKDIFEDMEGKK